MGMLIGDRSHIPNQEYQSFVSSGLVHIIAVSGGNILMIVVFLSAVLFFLPFYLRIAIILLTVLVYSAICGIDSSVIRATLMGGLSLLALFR
jgi:competence protein ComEC